ncbi:Saccharopine dehydrogenase [Diplonema papillatum]|nr:Saccharopine dehydrogenase [Diplonema papillatum]
MVNILLRGETKPQERRTALIPEDAKKLIDAGHKVTVERWSDRCFPIKDYEKVGCAVTAPNSWTKLKADDATLVLGLKELPEGKTPLPQKHIMFAHCFKNQDGWKDVMQRFVDGPGHLYDLEFLTDATGRRKVAFGHSAGFCGMGTGILAWAHQHQSATPMTKSAFPPGVFYPTRESFIATCKKSIATVGREPRIIIIGALGRCGSGAIDMAVQAGISEENIIKWDMKETAKGGPFPEIIEADIFVNCIYLNPTAKVAPFLTKELLQKESRKLSLMVDVSCDPNNPANPVPVYDECTTFVSPVKRVLEGGVPKGKVTAKKDLGVEGFGKTAKKGDVGTARAASNGKAEVVMEGSGAVFSYSARAFECKEPVAKPFDVVAIDHFPSLVPSESSTEFSHGLLPMLLDFETDKEGVWKRATETYEGKKKELASASS